MTIAALASRKVGGRQVKWIETRNENLLAGGHGGERTFLNTEVALDANGVITAIRSEHQDDCGAFPRYEPLGCVIWSQVLPATLKVRNLRIDFKQYATNKCSRRAPTGATQDCNTCGLWSGCWISAVTS